MHTDINNVQVTVAGRRELSPGAKALHWTAILLTGGMWYPVYWIAKRTTRNVRY